MRDGLPATLSFYRFLTTAGAPLAPLLLSYRLNREKEDPARLGERRGEAGVPRPPGPLVWVHGASVGEITAVLPLINHFCAEGFAVLVTSGTTTSAELAQQRLPAGAIHQFVPLDVPIFASRFLDHWQPGLALFVESDLWPNLVLASAERKIPLVLLNGRVSQRSFARWSRIPQTIGAVLRRFDLCLAQSPADAERYGRLGGTTRGHDRQSQAGRAGANGGTGRGGGDAGRHQRTAGVGRRLHASRRRGRGDGRAPAVAPPLPQPADHPRSTSSRIAARKLRSWHAVPA